MHNIRQALDRLEIRHCYFLFKRHQCTALAQPVSSRLWRFSNSQKTSNISGSHFEKFKVKTANGNGHPCNTVTASVKEMYELCCMLSNVALEKALREANVDVRKNYPIRLCKSFA
jgi:hypothetical protein